MIAVALRFAEPFSFVRVVLGFAKYLFYGANYDSEKIKAILLCRQDFA